MTRRSVVVGLAVAVVVAVAGGSVVVRGAGVPEGATYVGADKCRLCHLEQHKTWKESKHASNFDVLIGAERKNPDCVKCHTTGFGKPGGFVSEEGTPGLKNVGCESCHGPGSAHLETAKKAESSEGEKRDMKIDKVPQNACVVCHNPHISQKKRVEQLRKTAS